MIAQADSNMPSHEDFQALVQQANDGDQDALQKMREILDDNPTIWQHMGDLAQYARTSMLRQISGGDTLIAESVSRAADQLQERLTPESCSPLELLAVERVVANWLEMQYLDTLHPLPQGATIKQQRYHLSLKTSAQKRFEHSLKSLATLKRLLPAPKKLVTRKPAAVNRDDKRQCAPIEQFDPYHRLQVHFDELDSTTV